VIAAHFVQQAAGMSDVGRKHTLERMRGPDAIR
jgi:hypothetical protein